MEGSIPTAVSKATLALAAVLAAMLATSGVASPGPASVEASFDGLLDSGFDDVPAANQFSEPIAWLRVTGITQGCNPPANTSFCPHEPVTRGQMAAFLNRALDLPPTVLDRFDDDDGSVFEDDINALAANGTTAGCNPPAFDRFCPSQPVTRGQMAAFLVRGYDLPGSAADPFRDDDDSIFEADINALAAAGITVGCNPPANDRFCPDQPIARDQMAAFLWRANGSPDPAPPPLLVAAGDIARCELTSDEETAALLDHLFADRDGAVAALGDTVYESGTAQEFAECYEPGWGRHRSRTRPAVGNHEYKTPGASAYFEYFGDAAGDPSQGWYAYQLGSWRIVALNSNCSQIGGCEVGSPQHNWLAEELTSNSAQCTIAYMHHPRFSSGHHGDDDGLSDIWATMETHKVDVVLAGHDHNYERLAPLTSSGAVAGADGIQSFVVGTGGTWLRSADTGRLGSEVLLDDYHGVLALDLEDDGYRWQFIDTAGTVRDHGSRDCN